MPQTLRRLSADADERLVQALGRLLAERHRAHRLASPLLDQRFEDPAVAARQVGELLGTQGAGGAVAFQDGVPSGFLVGVPADPATWGPSVWVPAAGAAAQDAETVRDLYAAAAQPWVDAGLVAHFALVPASDPALVDGFFRSSFGLQHVHAARPPERFGRADGIRLAKPADIPVLAELDRVLPLHQGRSPVFSQGRLPTLEEAAAEWREDLGADGTATFVAEDRGRVVGVAVGVPLERSGTHTGPSRLADAGFLGYAAVLPQARGRGWGRRLGEAVIDWCAATGRRSVVTDWRATNLLSSRTWPRLGFEPTFLRLHRVVGY